MFSDSMPFYFCLALYGSIFAVTILIMITIVISRIISALITKDKKKKSHLRVIK